MQPRSKTFWSLAALAATALCAHADTARADALTFCIDKTSPSAAVDARLGQAVGKSSGTAVRLFYYKGLPKGDDDHFDLRDYKELLAERCDLVLGFPFDAATGKLPKFLKATQPYAKTGFVLVTRAGDTHANLAAFADGTKIAVVYDTVPNLYFRHHSNLVREIRADDADAVDALKHGDVAAAMLWQPGAVNALEHANALAKYEFHALDEANSSWNLVALYADRSAAQAQRFEAAIAAMRANGALAKALHRHADPSVSAADTAAAVLSRSARSSTKADKTCAGESTAKAKKAAKQGAAPAALYTAAQADAGKQVFADKCALCHGKELEGRNGPMLKGKMFLSAEAHHTLGEIFTIVAQNMPATAPATLSHDEYVKIMAHILQTNGFPAGDKELEFDAAKKSNAVLVFKTAK
jgi:mono/diheme cytochrome c family protein/ABC-type amino acid transport substrate-binding protein